MKQIRLITLIVVIASILSLVGGCSSGSQDVQKETSAVKQQQDIYNENQPVHTYDWSLPRALWNDFYDAQNKVMNTWSYIQPMTGGKPMFETPSQGLPTPRDTQLTNPLRLATLHMSSQWIEGVVEQPEPNGLFTSKNTDATIIMATNDDGTVSPIYTEQKVTCFPFPVRWVKDHFERVQGEKPSVKFTLKTHK